MTTKETGGPAFARASGQTATSMDSISQAGMTLRDYFAAKVIAGVSANGVESSAEGKAYIAMHAYKMADAMIEARKA